MHQSTDTMYGTTHNTIYDTMYECPVQSLRHIYRGKVRDLYELDDKHMLMVASDRLYRVDDDHILIVTTDRLSAFDVILPSGIPGKGIMLTAISNFWFERTRRIVPNHVELAEMTLEQALPNLDERANVIGRAIVVRKLRPLPVEAIVRGYLIGSGWRDFTLCLARNHEFLMYTIESYRVYSCA